MDIAERRTAFYISGDIFLCIFSVYTLLEEHLLQLFRNYKAVKANKALLLIIKDERRVYVPNKTPLLFQCI